MFLDGFTGSEEIHRNLSRAEASENAKALEHGPVKSLIEKLAHLVSLEKPRPIGQPPMKMNRRPPGVYVRSAEGELHLLNPEQQEKIRDGSALTPLEELPPTS